MSHALRRVDTADEALADLEVIVGFDDDLAGEVTRISNRIRGLLTQIHPALERVLGPKIQHRAVVELLTRFGGPNGLAGSTRRQLIAATKPRAPRSYEALVDAVQEALTEQTVTVPGTRAAELVLPKLAITLTGLLTQRAEAAKQIEEMLDVDPLSKVLTSMPGIGVRTGARILLEVGDGSSFPTSGHLAAYAGLAPVTRRSGTSIRSEHPSRAGNKQLKRAFFLAAFAALHDPASRAYYDRKRAAGKEAQRCSDLPGPPPCRRPPRHAPPRHSVRVPHAGCGLTKPIGTPPSLTVSSHNRVCCGTIPGFSERSLRPRRRGGQ